MNRLKKQLKSKKGFTLVEVIVVLVIIGILVAVMLPSLTGYIEEANRQATVAEARNILTALQTIVGLDTPKLMYGNDGTYVDKTFGVTDAGWDKVATLIGNPNKTKGETYKGEVTSLSFNQTNRTVSAFTFTSTSNIAVEYSATGGFTFG